MNKILENEWFWVLYPINGLVLDSRQKKMNTIFERNLHCVRLCVCVTFGLHFFFTALADALVPSSISPLFSYFFHTNTFQLDCFDIFVCKRIYDTYMLK